MGRPATVAEVIRKSSAQLVAEQESSKESNGQDPVTGLVRFYGLYENRVNDRRETQENL